MRRRWDWRIVLPAGLAVAVLAFALYWLRLRPAPGPEVEDRWVAARERMVETTIVARGVADKAVVSAMRSVPRHLFVPAGYVEHAYIDDPLPIGYGQTISQPYIVALMSELLAVKPGDRVLEVGTGSGYQAAVLAAMGAEVYSVEIIPELARSAEARLKELGYRVQVAERDGYYGWPEHAPYRAIVVTAAPDHIPQPLVNQLADGGRLVIPVGPPGLFQVLWLVERKGEEVRSQQLMGVRFVPLTGEH